MAGVTLMRHFAQTEADRQRRITESFSKAVEQLAHKDIEVRLGGIYTLERISKESPDDYWTSMETLTAFVRQRVRWRESDEEQSDDTQVGHEPEADIAAVLTVIVRRPEAARRREKREDTREDWRIDLRGADLRGAHLWKVHLEYAILFKTHFEEANLVQAHLEEAFLAEAHLRRALLDEAHLEGATAREAHLEEAKLEKAHLEGANFEKAHFERANLQLAHLEHAVFVEAQDGWKVWLGEEEGDLAALLQPLPADRLRIWPVDRKVNKVGNDGPELLEPHSMPAEEPVLL